jgi:hypothetical protein
MKWITGALTKPVLPASANHIINMSDGYADWKGTKFWSTSEKAVFAHAPTIWNAEYLSGGSAQFVI